MSSTAEYTLPAPLPGYPGAQPLRGNEPRRTFKSAILAIVPRWLQKQVGGSTLEAIGEQLDELRDRTVAGVRARFPGVQAEALPAIGRDRRIRRGRQETDATYSTRLLRWIDDHRVRGGPYALLAQLHAHYAPANFPIELRYVTGRNYTLNPTTGAVVRGDVVWTPLGLGGLTRWARWWLFYTWPTPVNTDGVWSDPGTWTDGGVWGSDLAVSEVRDLRLVPRDWNAAHAMGRIVVVSPAETVSLSIETS